MKNITRRIAMVAAALLIVTGITMATPGMVQSAQAATNDRVIPSGFQAYQNYINVTGSGRWYLQRKTTTGKWATVTSTKVTKTHTLNLKLIIAKTSVKHPKTITYREYAPAGGGYRAYYGAPYKIKYENPRAYTGIRKTYYNLMKSHCPDVTIRISANQEITPTGETSVAYYRTYYNQIVVEPNLPADAQKTTMLHECAHHLQDLAYSKGHHGRESRTTLEKQAAKAYHTSRALGLEYSADCVAQTWGGAYRAYGGPCATTGELNAAHRIAQKKTIY